MGLGIIEELELACLPASDEFVVARIDTESGMAWVSKGLGLFVCLSAPIGAFVRRDGKTPEYPGDIVKHESVL